jgi:hypothetical protein
MLVDVITCEECVWFRPYSKESRCGECECESVVSDNEGGASFSVDRCKDDYCSFAVRSDSE